jgi:hypothetical protein
MHNILDNSNYKLYALLTSGSTTFHPLGTNVYDHHNKPNLIIPLGSGSISTSVVYASMPSGLDNGVITSYNIVGTVYIHMAYPDQYINYNNLRTLVDKVDSYLQEHKTFDATQNYRIIDVQGTEVFNNHLEESDTYGAKLTVNISRRISNVQI